MESRSLFLKHLSLEDLGWSAFFAAGLAEVAQPGMVPARVVQQNRSLYRVRSQTGDWLAEVAGKVRYVAEECGDVPAVGDWVAVTLRPEEGRARIECILPRRGRLSRKAAGRGLTQQIVAANLDVVFIVTALDRDFNLRRIERYLALVWDSSARPIVLLNKADLCQEVEVRAAEVAGVSCGVTVHCLSAWSGYGVEAVGGFIRPGETAAFVGSSGVGKSTIINALAGETLPTQAVREGDDRGRHTTTTRQMFFLSGGGMVIDTPGMRELQLWEKEAGVGQTFSDVLDLAGQCRFRNCSHRGEPGCAVAEAMKDGRVAEERLESYRKLEAELRYQKSREDPVLAREQKERWKKIHKAIRKMPDKRG